MKVIRVLQIFTNMGRGGAESMIMNYYRHIDRTKVQFDFLVHRTERAAFDDEIETLGGKIYKIKPINPFFPKAYYKALRTFFKTHPEYKIVHSHINTFSTFPLKIAKEFKIPTRIAHAHIAMDPFSIVDSIKSFPELKEALKKIIKQQLKKKIHKHTTHYFACGNKAGKWLFGENTYFYVMNNAINTKTFCYNPKTENKLKNKFHLQNKVILGHVGRFTHQKNHDYVIHIFSKLLEKSKNYVLVLIGDGPLLSKIKESAKKLGVQEQVYFLGLQTNVHELLQMIDIFVFPSFYEGLPVTLIEAQAAGLKVLASNTITTEVQLTNDIKFLSINVPPLQWANMIIALGTIHKTNNFDKIVNGNYDIISNTSEIQEFYIKQNNF